MKKQNLLILILLILFSIACKKENTGMTADKIINDDNVYVTAPPHYIKKIIQYPQKVKSYGLFGSFNPNDIDYNEFFITEYYYSLINNKYMKTKDITTYYPLLNGMTDTTSEPTRTEIRIRKYIQLANGAITIDKFQYLVFQHDTLVTNTIKDNTEFFNSKYFYSAYDNSDYLLVDSCYNEFPLEVELHEQTRYIIKTNFYRDNLNRIYKIQKRKFDLSTNNFTSDTISPPEYIYYNIDNTIDSTFMYITNKFYYTNNTPSNAKPFNSYEFLFSRYNISRICCLNFLDHFKNYNPPLSNRLYKFEETNRLDIDGVLLFSSYYPDGNVEYLLFQKDYNDAGRIQYFYPLCLFIY